MWGAHGLDPRVRTRSYEHGSQRASLGRIILVRRLKGDESTFEPCIITRIRPGDIIDARSCADGQGVTHTRDTFAAHVAESVDEMVAGSWTWPPRMI